MNEYNTTIHHILELKGTMEVLRSEISNVHQLLVSKIDAGERENRQRFQFQDDTMKLIQARVDSHEGRFSNVVQTLSDKADAIDIKLHTELTSLKKELSDDIERIDGRVKVQELNWAKVLGFIVGTGLVSSGTTVGIIKLLGG